MAVKFEDLNPKLKLHVLKSSHFTVNQQGLVVVDGTRCAVEDIVYRLVCEGAISSTKLMELLK